MKEEKRKTLREWQEVVERLASAKALREVVDLQRQVLQLAYDEGLRESNRYPCAIVADEQGVATIEPWVTLKLEHIVLPDDVARSYALHQLEIGPVQISGSWGALPLETFSIETYAKQTPDQLIDVQKFNAPEARPGTKIKMLFLPVDGSKFPPPKVRGIAWCRIKLF